MKKRFGFTLAELLIILVVIGVICLASIPIIRGKLEKVDSISAYAGYTEAMDVASEIIYTTDTTGTSNLCSNLKDSANVSSSNCSSYGADDKSDFSKLTPNIVFGNGIKVYIQNNSKAPIEEVSPSNSSAVIDDYTIADLGKKFTRLFNRGVAALNPDAYTKAMADAHGINFCSSSAQCVPEGCCGYCPSGYYERTDYYVEQDGCGNTNYDGYPCTGCYTCSELCSLYPNEAPFYDSIGSAAPCTCNTCTITSCGTNETLYSPDSSGCYCDCKSGYTKYNGSCVEASGCTITSCGANETLYNSDSSSCYCECKSGYTKCNGSCVKNCDTGYTLDTSICTCIKDSEYMFGYVVYFDVDGDRGNSKLNKDIFKFYLLINGKVIPTGAAATDKNILTFDVVYDDFLDPTQGYPEKVLQPNLNFKEAACKSGYVSAQSDFCGNIAINSKCTDANNNCQIRVKRPYKGLK